MPLAVRIEAWCRARGHDPAGIEILAGDVSARAYARVTLQGSAAATTRTVIAVYYPRELTPVFDRFLETTAIYQAAGIRVPGVLDPGASLDHASLAGPAFHAGEESAGRLMLVEDLGRESLYDHGLVALERGHGWPALESWFRQAADLRHQIAALPANAVALLSPPLDRDLLRAELAMTWEHFLAPLGVVDDAAFAADLESAFDALSDALGAAPTVVCHRDFMARNLMIVEGALTVIDHQDSRIGPAAYDLASLLNDSLFAPRALESTLLAATHDVADVDYVRAVAQRTLKALGTFARATRAGSSAYRPLITPTLERAIAALARTPETMDLAATFATVCREIGPL